ncbi:MAG: hypothetical protein QM726_01320 [Chitinophagaceae bacterium]
MKKNYLLAFAAAISITLLFSCRHHNHGGSIGITISESGNVYKLEADYNEDLTGKVQRYINRQIQPSTLFTSTDDYFDANTELKDNTRFYIKSSPGRLQIKFNKNENSYESYTRIKAMYKGIANVLKEPQGQ